MRNKVTLLQECMDRAVADKEIAGCSLLLIRDGKTEAFVKSGYANMEQEKWMQRDTICHLYSQSKPITSAAAMLLVQDGFIDLCEPVGNYIKSFKNQRYADGNKIKKVPEDKSMRILDLMNMTSGLVYPGVNNPAEIATGFLMQDLIKRFDNCDTKTDDKDNPVAGMKDPRKKTSAKSKEMMTTQEFAQALGELPLAFVPGSHFCYGTSADVLGAVIEKVTGMSFSDFLKERFFEPLEMADTDFFVPEDKKDRLASVYRTVKGDLKEYKGNRLGIRNDGNRNAFESGGAGLFSTLDDYSHFAQMLMNGGSYNGKQILTENAVKYMTSGRLTSYQQKDLYGWRGLEGYTYGNLMRVLDDPSKSVLLGNKGEYGWDGWLGSYFMNDPETKTTVLMMIQKFDYGTGFVTRKLRNIIFS